MTDKKNNNLIFVPFRKVMELYNPDIFNYNKGIVVQTKIN
jgi:hypothetical protein